jgi:hypothetical protein
MTKKVKNTVDVPQILKNSVYGWQSASTGSNQPQSGRSEVYSLRVLLGVTAFFALRMG